MMMMEDRGSSTGCDDEVVTKQLPIWQKEHPKVAQTYARDQEGHTSSNLRASMRIGEQGPILMNDLQLIRQIQGLVQETIPARANNDGGSGVHGVFECTGDMSELSKAKLFIKGKKTKVLCRFSGSKDKGGSGLNRITPKGLSVKFYTEDGNLDLIGIHLPVFYFNDGLLYPALVASPYNPQSNLPDPTGRWDFLTGIPESAYASLYFMSDRGLPRSFRHMNFHTIHTFKLVSDTGYRYGRWSFCSNTKEEPCLSDEEVRRALKSCPHLYCQDMYTALAKNTKPFWTLYLQTMEEKQIKQLGDTLGWDAFDATKEWPQDLYPRIEVGTLTLTSNVKNNFVECELAGFSPGNLVPGIEPAYQDRLFAARVVTYLDAHNHRLGSNASMLPVNRPQGLKEELRTYLRDGPMYADRIQQGAPNYFRYSSADSQFPPFQSGRQPSQQELQQQQQFHRYSAQDFGNYNTAPRGFAYGQSVYRPVMFYNVS